jgi:hypothetical protein
MLKRIWTWRENIQSGMSISTSYRVLLLTIHLVTKCPALTEEVGLTFTEANEVLWSRSRVSAVRTGIRKKFANQDTRMMRKTIVQEYGIKVSE